MEALASQLRLGSGKADTRRHRGVLGGENDRGAEEATQNPGRSGWLKLFDIPVLYGVRARAGVQLGCGSSRCKLHTQRPSDSGMPQTAHTRSNPGKNLREPCAMSRILHAPYHVPCPSYRSALVALGLSSQQNRASSTVKAEHTS
jgi:hypothetical protein